MPRLTKSLPKYRHHRASGQAVVTLDGKDYYLGRYGSRTSKTEYDRLIAEWTSNGRRMPSKANDLTIAELCLAYWKFAEGHYRKDGQRTTELTNIRYALRPLKRLYGKTLVGDFGPRALKALQQEMIRENISRGVINSRVGKIKRVFKWAVSEEHCPASVWQSLTSVSGLQKGRTTAREASPVQPVADDRIDSTLPFLPPVVREMVRFQRLVGCRPSEVCMIRPCDIDRSSDVWAYQLESHKTEHHNRQRVIFIGPKAQRVLLPFLLRDAEAYCFSPAESEAKRKAELRRKRKSPVQPSQDDRAKQKAKRRPGDRYTAGSYLYAIRRACQHAFPEPGDLSDEELKQWRSKNWWSPNRLRHSVATDIRKRYGIEAAQVVLGHSKADVTQVYAERDLAKAQDIMRSVG